MSQRESSAGSSAGSSRWQTIGKGIAGLALVAAIVWLAKDGKEYVQQFREWVETLGFWGPAVFVFGYAVATVAFLPGWLLTVSAGAIFGLAFGTLWAFLGATLGASLSFLISRYLARGWVESKVAGWPRFKAIDKAIGKEGAKIVALLRLSPVFPFSLGNYALGLTNVKFVHYLIACFAMLPGTLLYVYYGKVFGAVAEEKGALEWVLLGVGLLATLAVTVIITKKAKKALEGEVEGDLEEGDGEDA
ncbi:MAG: TVP38/TMEM64 family protein [Acidobacteriota bacterium]